MELRNVQQVVVNRGVKARAQTVLPDPTTGGGTGGWSLPARGGAPTRCAGVFVRNPSDPEFPVQVPPMLRFPTGGQHPRMVSVDVAGRGPGGG